MTTTDIQSHKRRNGLIAAAAGFALLLGGGTYALWSASASISGGTITSGDIGLTVREGKAYDVSVDRFDKNVQVIKAGGKSLVFGPHLEPGWGIIKVNEAKEMMGHPVNLDTWRIVPGDTVAITKTFTVKLDGDNMVAHLWIDGTKFAPAATKNTDMSYNYAIFDSNGDQIGSGQSVSLHSRLPLAWFQASNAGQDDGVDDQYFSWELQAKAPVPKVDPVTKTADFTFVMFGHFKNTDKKDKGEQGQKNTNVADVIGDIDLHLEQIRSVTDGFGKPIKGDTPSPTPAKP